MPHKPFRELVGKMSPEAQVRVERSTQRILAEMELAELRDALRIRQQDIATKMKISQAAISQIERQPNIQLGTISDYVQALGGSLEVRVILPDRTIVLTHLAGNSGGKSPKKAPAKRLTRAGKLAAGARRGRRA